MSGRSERPRDDRRRAMLIALAAAVPAALVAGLVSFLVLAHGGSTGSPGSGGRFASAGPRATGPVAMAAPSLSARQAVVCLALLSQLPDTLRDQARRPVTAGAEQNAAYGEPPITLACAAGPRPSVPPDAQVYVLSNVCWYEQPGQNATTWTAIDREVPITVTVPNSYQAPGQWVIGFSGPITFAVKSIDTVPAGCRG